MIDWRVVCCDLGPTSMGVKVAIGSAAGYIQGISYGHCIPIRFQFYTIRIFSGSIRSDIMKLFFFKKGFENQNLNDSVDFPNFYRDGKFSLYLQRLTKQNWL